MGAQRIAAVLHYAPTPGLLAQLAAIESDWLRIVCVPEGDRGSFRREMAAAQALWHVLEPVTAEVIAAAPSLKLIQKIGVGVNTIDLDAARAAGVAVANMPGTNSQAVAEHALMLMLATLRRATLLDAATRRGEGWTFDRTRLDRVGELGGRSVGFVGFGAVPALLAPACAALGSRVAYTATAPKPGVPWRYCDLDELLAVSDVISLHVPLTPRTARMIDTRTIARMKPGAVLVNTARGALVDEDALVAALESGHLGGAGLDVFDAEPIRHDHPLLALENVVLSPHVAWLTPETLRRSLAVAAENCRRLRDGEPLLNRVA
jgi:phosphoglycerate dehydrogenase-like enzyme